MNTLFIIALIFLCLNISRFAISAVVILFKKEVALWLKIWNVIEISLIVWALIELIARYYR